MKATSLEEQLKGFALVKGDKKKLNKTMFSVAQRFLLGGYFQIGETKVYLTDIEFYYHEEGEEGKLHDFLMYHINMNATKDEGPFPPFPFGSLHSHISGIDFTFEDQNNPCAYRASILIRGVKWFENGEWKKETRPTYIYNNFLMGNTTFGDGFSIKWVDSTPIEVSISTRPRKNVPKFHDTGARVLFNNNIHSENQKLRLGKEDYVQDERLRWFFLAEQ